MRKIFILLLIIGLIAGLFISCIPTTPSEGGGEPVTEYVETITNQGGIGTFTVSDGQLSVEVLDADTEETIENIECFLSTDGIDAVILLVDPIGEYVPRLISCQNEYSNKGLLWDGLKLFYMDLKIKFIEGGSHLVYLDEYLPEGLTREILYQQYEHTKTTELKNLGGVFRGSINAWIDLGIGWIETQVVSLALTPISGVGGALYQIDSSVRTIDEALESVMISKFADKYENLGYEPDQKFEVWEAKWPSADFVLFLVLPCAPPKSSIPPTAYINSIIPNPAQQGETVTFNGHGTDPDGEIMLYIWESNIDGLLSNLESFNRSDLSVGTHIISFKVYDAGLNLSEPVSESLTIMSISNGSQEGIVSNVVAISWTDHIPENSQNIEHLINVFWDPYPEASGYKVYRNVNGVVEGEPVYSGPGELLSDKNVVQWHDTNIVVGNTYSYYVAAYSDGWETAPSQETGTINSFLPPIYLVGPSAGDTINNSTPTFEWSPVGSNPEGCKNFGTTELWVKDLTADKELVWQIVFDDMTTFSATYNQDGQASPLIPGHSYGWQVTSYGYAENMEDAISQSEYWEFMYIEGE